jgi:hypothetical protein
MSPFSSAVAPSATRPLGGQLGLPVRPFANKLGRQPLDVRLQGVDV